MKKIRSSGPGRGHIMKNIRSSGPGRGHITKNIWSSGPGREHITKNIWSSGPGRGHIINKKPTFKIKRGHFTYKKRIEEICNQKTKRKMPSAGDGFRYAIGNKTYAFITRNHNFANQNSVKIILLRTCKKNILTIWCATQ